MGKINLIGGLLLAVARPTRYTREAVQSEKSEYNPFRSVPCEQLCELNTDRAGGANQGMTRSVEDVNPFVDGSVRF